MNEEKLPFKAAKIPITVPTAVIEIITVLIIIFTVTVVSIKYNALPEQVAVHFNFWGEADRWGGKAVVLVVVILAVIIYAGISVGEFFPQLLNIPARLIDDNEKKVYRIAGIGIAFAKLMIVLMLVTSAVFTCFDKGLPYFLYIVYTAVFAGGLCLFIYGLKRSGKAGAKA
jgi:uncharacterized membrane protein